jgi:hypothetical protein
MNGDSAGVTLRTFAVLALCCGLGELLHWWELGAMMSALSDFYGPELVIVGLALLFALLQCGYAVYCFVKKAEPQDSRVYWQPPSACTANSLREEYAQFLQKKSSLEAPAVEAADYLRLRLERALDAASETDQAPLANNS